MKSASSLKILDIGCGMHKSPGSIGIDFNPLSEADYIHDLDIFPYPFKDNTFDVILCRSVLEHLNDVVKVMEEIHRVGKPGCIVKIIVPFFSSHWAHVDPTHKHFFTSHSFDYFIPGRECFSRYRYSKEYFNLFSVIQNFAS